MNDLCDFMNHLYYHLLLNVISFLGFHILKKGIRHRDKITRVPVCSSIIDVFLENYRMKKFQTCNNHKRYWPI